MGEISAEPAVVATPQPLYTIIAALENSHFQLRAH